MISHSTSRKRILVIDDEASICKLYQRILTEEGFEVETAADGRIALSMLSKREYDLYLLDIRMPLMDGKELYESLQKKSPHMVSRIVFITGSAMGQDTISFLQSSGRPILHKPFTIEGLKGIITQTLKAADK